MTLPAMRKLAQGYQFQICSLNEHATVAARVNRPFNESNLPVGDQFRSTWHDFLARSHTQVSALRPRLNFVVARSAAVPRQGSRSSLRAHSTHLVFAATTIAGLFAALLVAPLPIWSTQPTRPPAPGAQASEPMGWIGLIIPAAFLLALCIPFRPYVHAERLLEQEHVGSRVLIATTVLLAVTALLMFPGYGSDIFDYIGFERMWVVYGDNPLSALAVNHPRDWATAFVWYPDRTPAYGPLWALVTWPIVRLAGDSAALDVLGYKILAAAAYAACCLLIWQIAPSERRQRALVVFAWSPLVLFEVLGKVHNDVLGALSLLGAIWLATRRRHAIGLAALAAVAAGGLVKVSTLAAGPPALAYLWRHGRWRQVVPGVLLATLICLGLYVPFWEGLRTLAPIFNQTSRLVWSPATLAMLASAWLPGGPYDTPVRALLALIWVAVCLRVVVRHKLDSAADLATNAAWMLLGGILLLSSAVFAHYLVPAVALAAISQDERLQRVVLGLSLGGLVAYAVELLGLALGSAWIGSDAYRALGSLILLAPAGVMLLARWTR